MLSTPGFCDEVIHLYLATGLATVATRHEDDERIRVTWVAFEDAASLALDGEIRDAKTVVGLARAQSRRSRSDTAIGVG